ncbi:hypothetical protein CU306_07065 [Prochlorococcus marinus str. MU1414]|nr:hypothetical protein [Prochlorococcus marinus str. MU1414]
MKFKLKLGVKKRFKSSLNLELSHHMEQIQIRQPKMPAAQSFIQFLGTFLATIFISYSRTFSFIKNSFFIYRTAKSLGGTGFIIKNLTTFSKWGKCQRGDEFKNLSYLLCFINFQIYFLLIT